MIMMKTMMDVMTMQITASRQAVLVALRAAPVAVPILAVEDQAVALVEAPVAALEDQAVALRMFLI